MNTYFNNLRISQINNMYRYQRQNQHNIYFDRLYTDNNNWDQQACMLGCNKNKNKNKNYIKLDVSEYDIYEINCILCTSNVINDDNIIIVDPLCGHFICNTCYKPNINNKVIDLYRHNNHIFVYGLSGKCYYCKDNINGPTYFLPNIEGNICSTCFKLFFNKNVTWWKLLINMYCVCLRSKINL